jgi:hypothetical protein
MSRFNYFVRSMCELFLASFFKIYYLVKFAMVSQVFRLPGAFNKRVSITGQTICLDRLSDDVLLVMISFVAEFKDSKVLDTSLWPMIAPRSMPLNLGTGREISVIQSLSLVNKHFRSLVVHSVFHNVKVYGDWRRTLRCFDTLSKNVDLYPHVRYGRARILPSWIQLSIMRSVQHTNMLSQDSQTRHPTKLQ